MLKNIKIQNFRGIDELEISGFRKINIILGENNIGKTSFLEAIFLVFKPYAASIASVLAATRGLPMTLFINQAESDKIIDGKIQKQINFNQQALPLWKDILLYIKNDKSYSSIESKTEAVKEKISVKRNLIIKPFIFYQGFLDDSRKALEEIGNPKNIVEEDKSDFMYVLSKDEIKKESQKLVESYFCSGFSRNQQNPNNIDQNSNYNDFNAKKIKDEKFKYPEFKIFYYTASHTSNQNTIKTLKNEISIEDFKEIMSKISEIDDNISDIDFSKRDDEGNNLYVYFKNNLSLPFPLMGDGIKRAFGILCAIIYCKNGVLLIDEIDNGLHKATQTKFCNALIELATKHNVQIFATTHSIEMYDKFLTKIEDSEDKTFQLSHDTEPKSNLLTVIRLQKKDGKIIAGLNIDATEAIEIKNDRIDIRGM